MLDPEALNDLLREVEGACSPERLMAEARKSAARVPLGRRSSNVHESTSAYDEVRSMLEAQSAALRQQRRGLEVELDAYRDDDIDLRDLDISPYTKPRAQPAAPPPPSATEMLHRFELDKAVRQLQLVTEERDQALLALAEEREEREAAMLVLFEEREKREMQELLVKDILGELRHLRARNAMLERMTSAMHDHLEREAARGPSPPHQQEAAAAAGGFDLSNVRTAIEAAVKEAAALPQDEKNKKIKQLRLKWHPDKHEVLKEMAEEVTKIINECVEALDK